MLSFYEYIDQISPDDKNRLDFSMLKSSYRKYYMKEYKRIRKQHSKRIELQFTKKEFQQIEKKTSAYNYKRPTIFLKEIILHQLKKEIISPLPSEDLRGLTMQVKRCGNNINTICRAVNANKTVSFSDIEKLQQQIDRVEKSIEQKIYPQLK